MRLGAALDGVLFLEDPGRLELDGQVTAANRVGDASTKLRAVRVLTEAGLNLLSQTGTCLDFPRTQVFLGVYA